LKVKKKLETTAFNILPTKAGRGRFFFPSLAEGKNRLLPAFVEIVLLDNLGYLLGEIKLQTTIMNHCPDPSNRRFAGWHDFCPRMVLLARSKNRAKRVLTND
jgi:hypothetical protein